MTEERAINWELCIERAAGREDVAREMLTAIIDELPIHKRELQQAYDDRDVKLLANIAHKLSGLCCYSGLPQLKIAAQSLEEEVLHGSGDAVNDLYQSLLAHLDTVINSYNAEFV